MGNLVEKEENSLRIDPLISDEDLERFALQDKKSKIIGLYITLGVHIVILLLLIIFSIRTIRKQEYSFVTDADNQISKLLKEKEQEKLEKIKSIAKQELQNQLLDKSNYRNIPTNNSRNLKDAKGTNGEKLYRDAQELQNRIKEAAKLDKTDVVNVPSNSPKSREVKETSYKGPSVLSWVLDNRRALSLPIPVYKCQGGGTVTIQIIVGRNGYVKRATILSEQSATDECIRNAALNAAKISRFSHSDTAPENQVGEIVYQFIAQ